METQHELGNPLDNSPCTRPEEVEEILNYAVSHYNVDTSRIYLTGLSCGAYGVWEALPRLGARVAAAVPIAGNGEPSFGSTDCNQWVSPIWAFHGDADDVVRQDGSTDTIQGLRKCAPQPSEDLRLTIYPGVDHNSWDRAYTGTGEDDVFDWMLGYTSG
jgi:predicted peptidase